MAMFFPLFAAAADPQITDFMAKQYIRLTGRAQEAEETYRAMVNYRINALKKKKAPAADIAAAQKLLTPAVLNKHVQTLSGDLIQIVKKSFTYAELVPILAFLKSNAGQNFQLGEKKIKFALPGVYSSRINIITFKEFPKK